MSTAEQEFVPLHQPDPLMDLRLLEASKDAATIHLERHIKAKERNNWVADDIFTPDALGRLLPHRNEVKLGIGVGESVEVFLLTEDGITWYPRDVGHIFNPSGKRPHGDDSDPHEAFPRYWSTEEFQHATASKTAAMLLGRDMTKLELQRQRVVRSANVPYANSTATGIAYTAFQEGDTSAPYQVLVKSFKSHEEEAIEAGQPEVAEIFKLVGAVYKEMAQDERLHRSYIAANGEAALYSDDPELQLYMLTAIWDTSHDFTMPLQNEIQSNMDDFRRAVMIRRGGFFNEEMVIANRIHVMKKFLKIDKIPNLHGEAAKIQEDLGKLILSEAA